MTTVILIHALLFLAFWLTNLPYQTTLNNFLIAAAGRQVNYLLGFMLFSGAAALWSGSRMALRRLGRRVGPAWLYFSFGAAFLVFFYASFAVLFINNPAQLSRLGQLFWYFRLFIDAALLLFAAWGLRRRAKTGGLWKRVPLAAGLLVLWLIPVLLPPGNVYRCALPARPRLIAHRGASTLAPENTLAALRAAAGLGVYGVETDVSVSADGVPFLMHDNTLLRTTDVAAIFPGRAADPAETFTMEELARLDAGTWFDRAGEFSQEPVPTLEDALRVVKNYDLHFIYDLRVPTAGHPYSGKALDLCLDAVQAAGVAGRTWVLVPADAAARIRSAYPDVLLAWEIGYKDVPPSPASLINGGYRVVNSVYGLSDDMVRAYREAGLWVNVWVVDEPWQYSRLWLAGADSVTTSYPQVQLAMDRPLLAMPYGTFLAIWVFLGVIAAGVVYWPNRRPHRFISTTGLPTG